VLWIDTLSVVESARGQGIGTQIVQEFIRIGKERGYTAVKLEVINSNIRAKMLYSRLGFDITHYTNVPRPWSHLFGFTGVYQMTHSLI
jgi:ribosomal protein S18 acetylase RimI-like enzyme